MKKQGTKSRIVNAAWQLFYKQGYENTTIDEIVEASGTSKGSFYHYFEGKDALLGSLSMIFDEKYEELRGTMDPALDAADELLSTAPLFMPRLHAAPDAATRLKIIGCGDVAMAVLRRALSLPMPESPLPPWSGCCIGHSTGCPGSGSGTQFCG